jgi:acyl-CoA hydrolase
VVTGPLSFATIFADVIATEHGAVRLRGLTLAQRMQAMIPLAAPQHLERASRS